MKTGESSGKIDGPAESPAGRPDPQAVPRRDFLKASALAAAAAGTALSAATSPAADTKPAATAPAPRKTFLVIEGHIDDAEIGAGGVLIQAARAGHRVVIITVAGNYSSWAPTVGREERTKREAVELAQSFGFEKRFLNGNYHQTNASSLELKRQLADIYVELKPDVALISHHEDHWPDHSNSGLAAKDAIMFSHGLSHDLRSQRTPLIYGYGVTPVQTYHFEPDVYYDVTDVMPEYMDLISRVEAVRTGRPLQQEIRYEFRTLGSAGKTMPLSAHAMVRLAEAARWGNRAGCPFAIGFRTVWGPRWGQKIV